MRSIVTLTAALAALAATTTFAAATSAHDLEVRQKRQAERIEAGRKSGSITWREGLKLRAEQARIARLEAQYKADGRLDRFERARLKELRDEASRRIYREGHDGWSRWSVLPRVGR
jgi:hypothetical protein